MTDGKFTMPSLADMDKARRLTEDGRVKEAFAIFQQGFSGQSAAQPDNTHASLLPAGLRDVLGQALRSLRGIAPNVKGRRGVGLFEQPPQEQPPQGRKSDPRFVERSFSNAAGAREYKLFIPTERSGPRPLVIMLHGCTQSPDDFAAGTRMNALAEEDGIYVAYPRQTRGANMQGCWNWFEAGDQGRERGEVGIIAGITRAIMAEHPIDPDRVYVAGLSAGGAAAANVASAYSDLFAAVGIHSGLAAGCARDLSSALMAMRNGAPGNSEPSAGTGFGAGGAGGGLRVPTIVFHGENDMTVVQRNAEEILAQAGVSGLSANRESGQAHGHAYTRTRYSDDAGRPRVESWLVKGAGHAWSGGSPQGSYTDPQGPDASRAMLDFFRGQRLGRLQA